MKQNASGYNKACSEEVKQDKYDLMKQLLLVILLIGFCFTATAQNFILLEKNNGKKQFEIHPGTYMQCKTLDSLVHRGELTEVTDSSFVLNGNDLIYLKELKSVYYPRRFFPFLAELGLYVGGGYAVINSVNHVLNSESLADKSTLKIGGAGLSVALLSYLASIRHLKIEEGKWKVRLITYVQEEDL